MSYERRNKTKGVYKDEFDMYHENLNLIHLRRVIFREREREKEIERENDTGV